MSSVAVYSDGRILKEMHVNHEHIVIEPFSESQLNNCSYNVTLSEYFFRENNKPKFDPIFFNPWSERHVAKRWVSAEVNVATEADAERLALKPGDKYIPLAPFETILVATQEIIGGRGHITAMVKARSSTSRSLLSVCNGAGWGDVGYINRWTLMVTNLSRFAHVILPVGCSIAQIVFLECGYPNNPYKGKYQDTNNPDMKAEDLVKELKEKWTPAMMLPQLYKEYPVEDESSSSEEEEEVAAEFEVQKHPISTEISIS